METKAGGLDTHMPRQSTFVLRRLPMLGQDAVVNAGLGRYRLLCMSLSVVLLLSVVKALINWQGLEFLVLNQLFASAIAGAIFILGFLLRSVLSDYKEAERLPGTLRVALEAIHDDVVYFANGRGETGDIASVRRTLAGISATLREAIRADALDKKGAAIFAAVDGLSGQFLLLERLGMPANYVVRLRGSQDLLRRSLFRIVHIQHMQFLPSAHLLARSLVIALTGLLLFLKTSGAPESALLFAVVTYMLVYVLYLIDTLENPFGDTSKSFDDVSLFLLRDFEEKMQRLETTIPATTTPLGAQP